MMKNGEIYLLIVEFQFMPNSAITEQIFNGSP